MANTRMRMTAAALAAMIALTGTQGGDVAAPPRLPVPDAITEMR